MNICAKKPTSVVSLDDLNSFLTNGEQFCSELLENGGILEKIRPNQMRAARVLMMFAVQGAMEDMLVVDVAQLLCKQSMNMYKSHKTA